MLDHTAVHPESYDAAKALLTLCGFDTKAIGKQNLAGLKERVDGIGLQQAAEQLGIGVPTLQDIIKNCFSRGVTRVMNYRLQCCVPTYWT